MLVLGGVILHGPPTLRMRKLGISEVKKCANMGEPIRVLNKKSSYDFTCRDITFMWHKLLFIVLSHHINKHCNVLYIKENLKWS